MAPAVKRKRGEWNYGGRNEGPHRPSPHRPQNTDIGQQSEAQYRSGRGGRRGSASSVRGVRGGASVPAGNNPRSPTVASTAAASYASPAAPAMSPPPAKPLVNAPPAPVVSNEPVIAQTTSSRKLLPMPFHYLYLTDELLQKWQESGKAQIIGQATENIEDGMVLSVVFQEIVRSAIEERLSASELGSTVKDILASEAASSQDGVAEAFLDTFSIVTNNPDARTSTLAIPDVPNPQALRDLLTATEISAEILRNELELYVLMACGFLRKTFEKANIRYSTNSLYRQNAYNLLREESEGYSKLLTEYFNTNTLTDTKETPPDALVNQTHERIKALIGGFDLDVGRVLDVTLDVFANSLVRHFKFYIKYLRSSSWWPAEKTWDHVEWSAKPFSSLPAWAEPGYDATEQEEIETKKLKLREERDIQFWQRVQEVGFRAWQELGNRRLLNPEDKKKFERMEYPPLKNEKDQLEIQMDIEDNNWIGATGTMPPPSNRTAAQLLGFKLRFYASSARDPSDTLSENLIILAALLIKIGFISLRDLFEHLYPNEEEIEKVKAKLQEEKEERDRKARPGGGALNALAMAGALKDDDEPLPGRSLAASRLREANTGTSTPKPSSASGNEATASTTGDAKVPQEQLPEPKDQKHLLLKALLMIGAIPEALFMLGKYSWMMDLHEDLPRHIHRLLHHSLSKIWTSMQTLKDRATLRDQKDSGAGEQPDVPKGHLVPTKPSARKQLRWWNFEKENDQGIDYVFYWDDWTDNVPVCQTVDDVFLLCNSFLNISGVKIGQDPVLLSKLIQIGIYSLEHDNTAANLQRWLILCKRLLVPALSLVKNDPTVITQMWTLLKFWPTATRYNIYAEWHMGPTSRVPDIASAASLATARTKDVLKRISKENAKDQARKLMKIACASPGPVFSTILNQIESYDNMIDSVVTCCRYLTPLSYEVLTWMLMHTLGSIGRGRNRVQDDGMLTSPWLQSLAKFASSVYKEYQQSMSSSPILLYVANQVRKGNTTDLEILQQITYSMTGFSTDVTYSDRQVQLLAGGDMFVKKVMAATKDLRNDRRTMALAKTFMRQLSDRLHGEVGEPPVTQLILSIARETQLFEGREHMRDAPLKVLSINADRIFDILRVFLEALRQSMKPAEFDQYLPGLISLIKDFKIPPEIAWMICRPSIVAEIEKADEAQSSSKKTEPSKLEDVEMADAGDAEAAKVNGTPQESKTDKEFIEQSTVNGTDLVVKTIENADDDTVMKDVPAVKQDTAAHGTTPPTSNTPSVITEEGIHPVLKKYVEGFKDLEVLPAHFEDHVSLSFYVSFWQLGLRDVYGATDVYDDEKRRLEGQMKAVKETQHMSGQRKAAELTELTKQWEALAKESLVRTRHLNRVKARIAAEKPAWLNRNVTIKTGMHHALLEQCFFPRLKMSGTDAFYAFHMLMLLHKESVPGFRMMYMIDGLLVQEQLENMLFSCTAREAENFGRFLNLLFGLFKRWHADKSTYEAEAICTNKPKQYAGFAKNISTATWTPVDFLAHSDFRQLLYKYHNHLFKALKNCLQDSEYMRIRNGMLVLKTVVDSFPTVDVQGRSLLEVLKNLNENAAMQDIKLTAKAVQAFLKKKEKWWVTIQHFKLGSDAERKALQAAATSTNTRPSTPSSAALNAAAKEFKPSGTNGTTKLATSGKDEAEDGEIGEVDDSKKEVAQTSATPAAATLKPPPDASAPVSNQGAPAPPASTADAPLPSQASHSAARPDAGKDHLASPALSSVPPRLESSRPPSTQPAGRAPHALPNRPEGRIPSAKVSDRPGDRSIDYGRLAPHGDDHRQPHGISRRGRSRSPDRGGLSGGYREKRDTGYGHPRDAPYPRDGLDRHDARQNPNRHVVRELRSHPDVEQPRLSSTYEGRNRPTGQEPSSVDPGAHTHREHTMNVERTALINRGEQISTAPHHDRPPVVSSRSGYHRDERPHPPERDGSRRFDLSRSDKDSRGRGSRPQSPRHGDERPSTRAEPPRDDRRDDRLQPERPHPSHSSSRDPPPGPREPRSARDLFGGPPPSRPPVDPNHGRLSQDFAVPSRPSDPNYGRLNTSGSGPPDAPSGPRESRGRNAPLRGGRNFTAPAPGAPQDMSLLAHSPGLDRVPSGPSFNRRDPSGRGPRDMDGHGRSNSMSAPHTSASEQPPSGPAEMTGVHPSRQHQIKPVPDPLQTNNLPSPSFPPSGPRSARGGYSATGSPVTTRSGHHGPPTGPSAAASATSERERRPDGERGDKRFSHLQGILTQQSPSTDGRASPFDRSDRVRDRSDRDTRDVERERDRDRGRGRGLEDDRGSGGATIRGRASRQTTFTNDGPASSSPSMAPAPPVGGPLPPVGSTSRNEQYRDRHELNDGSSRRRRRSRSPGRERHGGTEEREAGGRGRDEKPARGPDSSSRAPSPGGGHNGERESRRRDDRDRSERDYDRSERDYGRDRERGLPRGGVRDDGGHSHSLPALPPEQHLQRGAGRAGTREMDLHWGGPGDGRNGDFRRAGRSGEQDRRVSNKRRAGDDGSILEQKRPRRYG